MGTDEGRRQQGAERYLEFGSRGSSLPEEKPAADEHGLLPFPPVQVGRPLGEVGVYATDLAEHIRGHEHTRGQNDLF